MTDQKFTAILGGTVIALAIIILAFKYAINPAEPPKGYKIKIKEVVYLVDTYIMDREYLIFQDELGREVEVHKNFVTVEEIKQ